MLSHDVMAVGMLTYVAIHKNALACVQTFVPSCMLLVQQSTKSLVPDQDLVSHKQELSVHNAQHVCN